MSSVDSSTDVAFLADYRPIKTNQATPKIKSTVTGGSDGGGGGNGMENRLARLESDVTHLQSDVTDIKRYGIGFSAFFVVLIVGLVAGALNWQSHKFDRVEDKFDVFDGRLDSLEVSMGKVEVRLDNVEAKLGGIEVKLNAIEGTLGGVETILIDVRDSLNKDPK